MLLILIFTIMQIMGLPPGTQGMVQGVVVILVLALAGREAATRRTRGVSVVDAGQNASSAAAVTATEQ